MDIDTVSDCQSLSDPSPKRLASSSRSSLDKNQPTLPILPVSSNEEQLPSTPHDPIYGNVQTRQLILKQDSSIDDEGDLIEHDLLNLVHEEEEKDLPPALPIKRRALTSAAILTTTPDSSSNHLDVHIDPNAKLVHPGKDRPRRANIRRPIKRSGNGASNDNSFEGGLFTDENDDVTQSDLFPKASNESSSLAESSPTESSTP